MFKAILAVTICLSAFLLFQVQLILGKFLLPWFGGISAVWATCLVFFQVLLFLGYLYSHKVCGLLNLRRQANVHFLLLGLATAAVVIAWAFWGSPFLPTVNWKPEPGVPLVAAILKLLLIAIGLPFLLLSSTGPLLQKWYAEIRGHDTGQSPYFLYALSNAGSLLGLLTYPIWFEPRLGTEWQSRVWGAGFVVFVFTCGVCAWNFARHARPARVRAAVVSKYPAATQGYLWFTLAALGSVMLLATTNLLTQDVAPVPLLWVLPLSVYLLSFIVAFQKRNFYFRGLFHPLFAVMALLTLIAFFRGTQMHVGKQVGVYLTMLFAACMVCHGEVARIKPEGRHLTTFYLALSGGGALGAIFVGIIAPLIFPAIWEYHIGLWAIAAVVIVILYLDKHSWLHAPRPDPLIPAVFFGAIVLLPKYLARLGMVTIPMKFATAYNILIAVTLLLLALLTFGISPERRRSFRCSHITVGTAFVLLSCALYGHLAAHDGDLLYRARNFYGALSVRRNWDRDMLHSNFSLMHGRILHGLQIEQNRGLATSYYDKDSGIGLALLNSPRLQKGNMRIGVIGMGAGTVGAYGRPGDAYRFYEINPAVVRLAQGDGGYFSFLKDSRAKIEIVLGDARLSLEREAANHDFQNFDVLIVDAFNGDSIPVHLLTREAMKLYLSHLRGPDSVIALHISNLVIDLAPPIAALARCYGLNAARVATANDTGVIMQSDWILLTPGESLNVPNVQNAAKPILAFDRGGDAVWADDYSNLVGLIDYHGLLRKTWVPF